MSNDVNELDIPGPARDLFGCWKADRSPPREFIRFEPRLITIYMHGSLAKYTPKYARDQVWLEATKDARTGTVRLGNW